MNKKQAREIARRWIGGAAISYFPDLDGADQLSEQDASKITAACIELGERLIGNNEYLNNLPDIINAVMGKGGKKFKP